MTKGRNVTGRRVTAPRFAGKVAVVTGAANGIGAATATRLAREGCAVVVADIDACSGSRLADDLSTDGADVLYYSLDAASLTRWGSLRAAIEHRWNRLDIVVSNAHLQQPGAAHEITEASWHRQMDVNVKPLYLAAATFADMLQASAGSMVAVSSVHASFGFPRHPAYAASKGAICALVRQLAVEYGPDVRVNCVLPGPILTRTWGSLDTSAQHEIGSHTTLGRMGRPDEVAAVIAFLASEDASYLSGVSLPVDGGWTVTKA